MKGDREFASPAISPGTPSPLGRWLGGSALVHAALLALLVTLAARDVGEREDVLKVSLVTVGPGPAAALPAPMPPALQKPRSGAPGREGAGRLGGDGRPAGGLPPRRELAAPAPAAVVASEILSGPKVEGVKRREAPASEAAGGEPGRPAGPSPPADSSSPAPAPPETATAPSGALAPSAAEAPALGLAAGGGIGSAHGQPVAARGNEAADPGMALVPGTDRSSGGADPAAAGASTQGAGRGLGLGHGPGRGLGSADGPGGGLGGLGPGAGGAGTGTGGSGPSRPPDLGDLLARIRRRIEAAKRYPEDARRDGIQGTVAVRFRVGAGGQAERVEVMRSSGFRVLDDASVETIRRAAPFPPARGWVQVPIAYTLAEPDR